MAASIAIGMYYGSVNESGEKLVMGIMQYFPNKNVTFQSNSTCLE